MHNTRDPGPVLTGRIIGKAILAFGGRVLRVVRRPAGQEMSVITAHFDTAPPR